MPEDCILAYDYNGKIEEADHDEIYDFYGLTSYLENFGRRGTDGKVQQAVEFKEVAEDLGPSDHIADIGGADYGLFS